MASLVLAILRICIEESSKNLHFLLNGPHLSDSRASVLTIVFFFVVAEQIASHAQVSQFQNHFQ